MNSAVDFWAIPYGMVVLFYILAAIAVLIFFLGFYGKAQVWASGKDGKDPLVGLGPVGLLWFSVREFFSSDCLRAKRVIRWSVPRALLLIGIIWGFLLLFLGTVARSLNTYILEFLSGGVWRLFSLVLDLAGLALLVGVVYGLIRRYVVKPEKMATSIRDGYFLLLLLLVILSGFASEGTRLIAMNPAGMDWSPIGYLFGAAMAGAGEASLKGLHLAFWIIHAVLSLSLIAYIPYSKGFHIFASQITTSLASVRKTRAAR
jgi:nitrate reductase gamma subunit